MNSHRNFLDSSRKLFDYYKSLTDKAIQQVDEEQFFYQENEGSNSIAIILKHLTGNIRSRWHEFQTTDGEKPWRNRDKEFVLTDHSKATYIENWEAAWKVLWREFKMVSDDQLMDIVYIRNEGHSIIEALQRQLTHLSYHVGQIVYIAKALNGSTWESLSISKNKSSKFNKEHFDRDKKTTHFTDK